MNVFEIKVVGCGMSKICIFNEKRVCSNCGECEVCELNSNKKCNNCGKCLELEGYDVKAIKIDEVFEDAAINVVADDIYIEDECDLHEENKTEDDIDKSPKLKEYDLLLAEQELSNLDKDDFIPENNEVWEFIDDIEGVKDLMENEEENSELLEEEFPGLIRLKKI